MYKPDLEGDNSFYLNDVVSSNAFHLNFIYKKLINHKVNVGEISKLQGDIALGNYNCVDIEEIYLVNLNNALRKGYIDEIIYYFGHYIPF